MKSGTDVAMGPGFVLVLSSVLAFVQARYIHLHHCKPFYYGPHFAHNTKVMLEQKGTP